MQGLTSTQREALIIILQIPAGEHTTVEQHIYDAAISLMPRGITYIDAFIEGHAIVRARPKESKFILDLDTMARTSTPI